MSERTLAIIKPDAVERKLAGRIIQRIEDEGFRVAAMRRVHLTQAQAEGFYAVHRARPIFAGLTSFMSSGPAIVMVLEAQDAIKKWRTLMGATDPAKADAGTLRKEFAESIERNATHGSDAPETAAYEIGYFFPGVDLIQLH
jgi:nucleoside-diphosphate kinase